MAAPLTTAERLARELPDPVPMKQVAKALGIGLTSAYDSAHQFVAARRSGDEARMRENVPCLRRGAHFIVPRDTFIRWYVSAGLDADLLERLYGDDAA